MKPDETHPRYERLEPTLKQRIFDAALREFGRFGYTAASMNRLVEGAGISKGALFKYFGTKSGLFGYVYNTTMEEVKTVLRDVRDTSRDEPFFTRLEKVIAAGIRFTTEHPLSAAVYYRVIYTGDAPHGNRTFAEIQDTSKRFLRSLVEDGLAKGELREGLDAGRASFIIQSVLDRLLQAHYLEFMAPALVAGSEDTTGDYGSWETWAREIVDIFRNGMAKE